MSSTKKTKKCECGPFTETPCENCWKKEQDTKATPSNKCAFCGKSGTYTSLTQYCGYLACSKCKKDKEEDYMNI
jgi:hypothetical protein